MLCGPILGALVVSKIIDSISSIPFSPTGNIVMTHGNSDLVLISTCLKITNLNKCTTSAKEEQHILYSALTRQIGLLTKKPTPFPKLAFYFFTRTVSAQQDRHSRDVSARAVLSSSGYNSLLFFWFLVRTLVTKDITTISSAIN